MIDELALKLCDIQGRLFELSVQNGYNSALFVKSFMTSVTAKELDSEYNRMQWAGEEYLLEEIVSSNDAIAASDGDVFSADILYWIGYLYRYWHFYTGEDSARIYKQAPVEIVKRNYMMFYAMDPTLAIEDLKEIYGQNQG